MKPLFFLAVVPVLIMGLIGVGHSQQPQTGSPNPQALQGINAKWSNGVGPGYWPYQSSSQGCTGLNLCIGPGTSAQCMGSSHVTYAGTTSFALTNNATNYVYLDLDNSCVPAVNTSGYSNRNIAIAKVVTSGGAVTSLLDDRTWNGSQVVLGGVDAQTGTSYTIAATDRNKLVTISNSSAIAVTLPTTLGATFTVAVQNINTGTATLTPSSGTINGASNIALTGGTGSTGQGAWLFFDGTNWEAMIGGGGSSSGGGFQGVNVQTTSYTLVSGDSGKLVVMNCSSACTITMYGSPTATYWGWIISVGSTTATVSLNSKTFNGSSSVPVLIKFMPVAFWSDGTNYYGDPPLVAGTNIGFTPAANGLTIANTASGNFADNETPSGSIDGSNTSFTLANTPSPSASLSCYLNGLEQRSGASNDFTLSTATITYNAAPQTGDTLVCSYRY